MQCSYFDAGVCRSCTLMGQPYEQQVRQKQQHCEQLLAKHEGLHWLEPMAGPESGYRNKAKMVVGGSTQALTLGILDHHGDGVDLRECGICSPGLQAVFPTLAAFITTQGLTPYDVPARRGELKNLIITESPQGELMLRFVLRSEAQLDRIRRGLAGLLERMPQLAVVTANILPEHKAVLEGEHEIVLTERTTLPMRLDGMALQLRPQGFFQTNSTIAAALYRQGREWVDEAAPDSLWDLYCGVGGFALAAADGRRAVVGIETSAEAVAGAELARDAAGLENVRFVAADATAFAASSPEVPELVIVNPPRRGIGTELSAWLEASAVPRIIYSSCNATSLAKDLAAMPSYRPVRARLFDMFPQTAHHEVMVLLARR